MADSNEKKFDDLDQQISTENRDHSGLQGLMRVISCLPCFPSYVPLPETPNLNQLKMMYVHFKQQDSEKIEISFIERSKSVELSAWTNKIIFYLPSVTDAPESLDCQTNLVSHFNTIKKFYSVVKNAGFESSEMEALFNIIQLYESVTSVVFVILNQHPESMKSITEQINKAIEKIEQYAQIGCLSLICCGAAILSQFNRIIGIVDEKLGEMGITKIGEYFFSLIEVFCKLTHVDLKDTEKLKALSESIQDMVKSISTLLRSTFGDSIPSPDRKSKWGPLDVTERIQAKLSKFETQSVVVERTVKSFESFFKAVEKIDDNFEELKIKSSQRQAAQPPDVSANENEDFVRAESRLNIASEILARNESAVEEVRKTARFFQHLETILSYGVLLFKNEDDILNPLLDNVDECTRIIEKFAALHPLYKILLGKNYLSNLKVIVKKIVELLKSSKLLFNSPKEFLRELKQKYPNLIYLLCESYLNDHLKKKLEFLPDSLENALNSSLSKALDKFKIRL